MPRCHAALRTLWSPSIPFLSKLQHHGLGAAASWARRHSIVSYKLQHRGLGATAMQYVTAASAAPCGCPASPF
jgi:hypothetical protein